MSSASSEYGMSGTLALKGMFTCIQDGFELLELHKSEPQDVLAFSAKNDELYGSWVIAKNTSASFDHVQVMTFKRLTGMMADVRKMLLKEYEKRAYTLKVHVGRSYVAMLT